MKFNGQVSTRGEPFDISCRSTAIHPTPPLQPVSVNLLSLRLLKAKLRTQTHVEIHWKRMANQMNHRSQYRFFLFMNSRNKKRKKNLQTRDIVCIIERRETVRCQIDRYVAHWYSNLQRTWSRKIVRGASHGSHDECRSQSSLRFTSVIDCWI